MSVSELGAIGARGPLLGHIVTWSMPGVEIPYERVVSALDAAGLPTTEAAELRAATAFTRAIKELREGRVIRKIPTDLENTCYFQFTREHIDKSGLEIDYSKEALCRLDTSTGEIACPDSPAIEEHAQRMFAHAMGHRSTTDITRLVQKMFASHADLFSINPQKGVAYFVPAKFASFAEQVEEFFSACGGQFHRFPVPTGTAEGNRSVKSAVEEGLKSLSDELEDCVNSWNDKTRESTMTKAIERWKVLKHKAEAYGEYLGDRQANLLSLLDEQKRRLAAKIADCTATDEPEPQQTLFSTSRIEDETLALA